MRAQSRETKAQDRHHDDPDRGKADGSAYRSAKAGAARTPRRHRGARDHHLWCELLVRKRPEPGELPQAQVVSHPGLLTRSLRDLRAALEVPHPMLQWFQIVKFHSLVAIALLTFLLCRLTSQAQGIVINEIITSNTHTLLDENGDSSDWIELYNASGAPVSLAGYRLSDDAALPFKWTFRDAAIGPGGFLLVFASGKDRQPGVVGPTNPAAIAGLKVWLRADAVA